MNDMLPKVAAYLDSRDWNDVPAMQDRKFTVSPLALYRQHGSKLRQFHCQPAAGNDSLGWVAYQTRFSGMKNPDTWAKLKQYMNIAFIRSLFDPFIQNKSFRLDIFL